MHKLEVVAQIHMKEEQLGNVLDIRKNLVILSFKDMLHVNTPTKKKN